MRTYADWLTAVMLGTAAFGVLYLAILVMVVWPLQDRRKR